MNFTNCLTAYMTGCQWWSLRASAVSLSISKSASSSHHQQTGSFQSQQQTTGEYNARNAEKWEGWVLSWLKQHCDFPVYFNQTWCKVYICLTVVENFTQKSSRVAEILTKVVGASSFVFTLYDLLHPWLYVRVFSYIMLNG